MPSLPEDGRGFGAFSIDCPVTVQPVGPEQPRNVTFPMRRGRLEKGATHPECYGKFVAPPAAASGFLGGTQSRGESDRE